MVKSPDKYNADGFGEAPQSELEGTPLSGSISDWAKQISEETAKPQPKVCSMLAPIFPAVHLPTSTIPTRRPTSLQERTVRWIGQ